MPALRALASSAIHHVGGSDCRALSARTEERNEKDERLRGVREITSRSLLLTKAVLFVVLGAIAAGLLLARSPELASVLLLAICVWAFARAYYFLFYVIEHYVDPAFKYSGIGSALRYLVTRRSS
jgi:hypothetical protein